MGKTVMENVAEVVQAMNAKQIVTKDGKVMCVRSTPYDAETVKQMKKAGYKVKEVKE